MDESETAAAQEAQRWPRHFSPEIVRHAYGGGKLTSFCLSLEAWRRGLPVTFVGPTMRSFRIGPSEQAIMFNDSRPQTLTRRRDYARALRKFEANARMRRSGVPVPRGELIASGAEERAVVEAAQRVGFPLVLKPDAGTMGRGVLTGISDVDELLRGYRHLVKELGGPELIMESMHSGDDHRLLVVGEQVVAATRRIPTHVIGDGRSTIRELIEAKNTQRRRNPFLSSGLIKVDYEVRAELSARGHTLDSVAGAEEHVRLRRMANGSAGADVEDVTQTIAEHVRQTAVAAVRAFPHLHVAGVDLLHDPSAPEGEGSVVIEVNTRPHIPTNMYPSIGTGQDVPKALIDHFFPDHPRPELPGDEQLVYDYEVLSEVMRSRVVREATLTPLPEDHLPHRWQVEITVPEAARARVRRRQDVILQRATAAGLSGEIQESPEHGGLHLVLAGSDPTEIEEFLRKLEKTLDGEADAVRQWDGEIVHGFRRRPAAAQRRGATKRKTAAPAEGAGR